jgi:hypothetical protein
VEINWEVLQEESRWRSFHRENQITKYRHLRFDMFYLSLSGLPPDDGLLAMCVSNSHGGFPHVVVRGDLTYHWGPTNSGNQILL